MDIVITGLGVHTSIGNRVDAFWDGLLEGRSGNRPIRSFDVGGYRNQNGCEIADIPDSTAFGEPLSSMGRTTRILVPALEEALADAGLTAEECGSFRTGLCVGTTMGEIGPLEAALRTGVPGATGGPQAIVDNVSRLIPLSGPKWTFTNACAAGNFAIAKCMDELRLRRAEVMIAAGVDAMSWVAFVGFGSLRAMSTDVCRPFDRDRKGLILGEGAGVLVLETKEHHLRRKSRARARLLGYGFNCDAHHITQPDPDAAGAIRAMRTALRMAEMTPEQIGYVSAHGTGTLANDRMESRAIQAVFGNAEQPVGVSSIKGHIGHTLGAASSIEAVMCVKALETGIFPPTLGLREIDPLCRMDRLRLLRTPWTKPADVVLSNSYAFGGVNSSIVLGIGQERGER